MFSLPTSTNHRTAAPISRALAERIESLCRTLLPNGRRRGSEWRIGSSSGEPGHSLGVRLVGAKTGVWADFATGESGDALDLVAAVLDIPLSEAMRWADTWLGGLSGM